MKRARARLLVQRPPLPDMSVVASPLGVEGRGPGSEVAGAPAGQAIAVAEDPQPAADVALPEPAAPAIRAGSAGLLQRAPDNPPPPPPTDLGGSGGSAQPTDTQAAGGSSTTITVKAATRALSAPNLTALWS